MGSECTKEASVFASGTFSPRVPRLLMQLHPVPGKRCSCFKELQTNATLVPLLVVKDLNPEHYSFIAHILQRWTYISHRMNKLEILSFHFTLHTLIPTFLTLRLHC